MDTNFSAQATAPFVNILEVGARDGLQNEAEIVSTANKLGLITRMVDAGVKRMEVASFVHPARVPQMADAEAVIAGLPDRDDISYIGLCLNKRGVLRGLATREGNRRGIDEAGCVIVASDTFGQKNQGQTIKQGIRENREMIRFARAEGLKAQVTISAAFGCPFEGAAKPETIFHIVEELAAENPLEITLADTIGVGVPAQVTDLFGRLREILPDHITMRAHFHDTRNTGIANAWAAVQAGVQTLDSSLGGLGGCPFAPNATGNIATEDLVNLLDRSGIEHDLDLRKAISTNQWFAGVLDRPLPSLVARAEA
ncbi:hydroxymethylglutaryl-CoA lyase [Parasphingorhabdus sp.]|uniref:hydroxymethylglutaryl-CoA lyase n=1 Tax=Parasphingorhabdus sp. TaxID=2709688 RepID=UPI003A93E390